MSQIDSISFFDSERRKAANPNEHNCPKCGTQMRDMGRYLPEYRCQNPKCEDWYARPRHVKVQP